jgi:hypothetical protein
MDERTWNGWVGFAALLVLIVGAMDFLIGLIAVIRGSYTVVHGSQLIIFDTTGWGWITLLLGIATVLVGLGLAGGASWARWVTLVVVTFGLLEHLLWRGESVTLWSLTVLAMQIIVIYALTAKWNEPAAPPRAPAA